MFVRNCWYVAAWDHEIPDRRIISRMILGEPLALYRRHDGAIVALEDRCVHRQAPLSLGRLEGDDVRCMYHGLKFEPSGRCVDIPGTGRDIPSRACVKTYPALSRESWIWVWMGSPDHADPSLIPQAVGLNHPVYVLKGSQLDYDANYQLINDNLTDFSHLSYVHVKSFGADEKWAQTRPNVEALDRGIRVSRWIEGSPPIPPIGEAAKHAEVDIWSSYDFLAPGVLLMFTGLYVKGTAQRIGGKAPPGDMQSLHSNFTSQAVTATTANTSRYFFGWGPNRVEGDETVAGAMLDIAMSAFLEDKTIIEAQQRVINLDPDRPPMPLPSDRAVMLFQRIMRRLAEEATEPVVS